VNKRDVTSTPQYMWSMGVVCSLFLFAFGVSFALDGKFPYKFEFFGTESGGVIRNDTDHFRFWLVIGCILACGAVGIAVSGIGLFKARSKVDKMVPNQSSDPALASGTSPAGQEPRHR
jgi:hypothetical protein